MRVSKREGKSTLSISSGQLLSGWHSCLLTLVTLLGVVTFLLTVANPQPLRVLSSFFLESFRSVTLFGNMLDRMGSLMLVALGVLIAFQSGNFNLGGEGQVYAGAFTAGILALAFPLLESPWSFLITLSGAALIGALLALFSGICKVLWGVSEVITSFLLSHLVLLLIRYLLKLVTGDSSGDMIATGEMASSYHLMRILPPSWLNVSLFFSVAAVVGVQCYLYHTRGGLTLRLAGQSSEFASYSGVSPKKKTLLALSLSGLFHGVAGAVVVLGGPHRVVAGLTVGLGWDGITVALIARFQPWATLPSALLWAYIDSGAHVSLVDKQMISGIIDIAQALILLLITARFCQLRRSRWE